MAKRPPSRWRRSDGLDCEAGTRSRGLRCVADSSGGGCEERATPLRDRRTRQCRAKRQATSRRSYRVPPVGSPPRRRRGAGGGGRSASRVFAPIVRSGFLVCNSPPLCRQKTRVENPPNNLIQGNKVRQPVTARVCGRLPSQKTPPPKAAKILKFLLAQMRILRTLLGVRSHAN